MLVQGSPLGPAQTTQPLSYQLAVAALLQFVFELLLVFLCVVDWLEILEHAMEHFDLQTGCSQTLRSLEHPAGHLNSSAPHLSHRTRTPHVPPLHVPSMSYDWPQHDLAKRGNTPNSEEVLIHSRTRFRQKTLGSLVE